MTTKRKRRMWIEEPLILSVTNFAEQLRLDIVDVTNNRKRVVLCIGLRDLPAIGLACRNQLAKFREELDAVEKAYHGG